MNTEDSIEILVPSKVIVIDDIYKEVAPLLQTLWSYDIPVLYYSGKKIELPLTPISGIRIVFLDMELDGMAGQSTENKCSTLMNVLRKTIAVDNGPYLIMAWTKHDYLIQALEKSIEQRGKNVPRPYFFVNMEKGECLDGEKVNYELISKNLLEKLKELPIFRYFFTWEKLVTSQIPKVIALLCSKANKNSRLEWRNEVNKILCKLAIAYSGYALEEEEVTSTQSSMRVLNSLLLDYVEKGVSSIKTEFVPCSDDIEVDSKIQAELNTKIHLRNVDSKTEVIEPGNIYLLSSHKELDSYVTFLPESPIEFKLEFFNRFNDKVKDKELKKAMSKCRLAMLEVTPMCDYAFRKWRACRFLPGLMIPKMNLLDKRLNKKAQYLHSTPEFLEKDIIYRFVFNSHYLFATPFTNIRTIKPKYQMRLDLLSSIQNEVSYQLSRKGIIEVRS